MTVQTPTAPLPRAVARRYRHRYAVLDVETTGLKPEQGDKIVQIAVTLLDARGVVERTWSTLVDPRRDPGPTHVHGITAERLVGAPTFDQVAPSLAALLGDRVFVAHNARFDWTFVAAEMAAAGVPLRVQDRLCTWRLAKRLQLPVENLQLATLAAHWGIDQVRAHDAVDDTRVLVEVLREQLAQARAARVRLPMHRVGGARFSARRVLDAARVIGFRKRAAR